MGGAMLGKMVYMPAMIELVEALVMPHRRGQHSFPWQIRVPEHYVGKEYEELFFDLAQGRDIMKNPDVGTDRESPRQHHRVSGAERVRMGVAVAMALYRKTENKENDIWAPGTGGGNYTILAPPPSLKLCAG